MATRLFKLRCGFHHQEVSPCFAEITSTESMTTVGLLDRCNQMTISSPFEVVSMWTCQNFLGQNIAGITTNQDGCGRVSFAPVQAVAFLGFASDLLSSVFHECVPESDHVCCGGQGKRSVDFGSLALHLMYIKGATSGRVCDSAMYTARCSRYGQQAFLFQ